MLGLKEFNKAFNIEQEKLYIKMVNANRVGELDNYLNESNFIIRPNSRKALVLGYSQISKNLIQEVFDEYGFEEENVDICIEKSTIKNFDCKKLINKKYDVVIIGQLPHKLKNVRCGDGGLIGEIINNVDKYANAYIAKINSRVRITRKSLEEVLTQNMKQRYNLN